MSNIPMTRLLRLVLLVPIFFAFSGEDCNKPSKEKVNRCIEMCSTKVLLLSEDKDSAMLDCNGCVPPEGYKTPIITIKK